MRELVEKYKQRKLSFDKQHETLGNENEDDNFIGTSIFDHLAFNIFYIYNGCNFSNCNVYSSKTYIQRRENVDISNKFGNDMRCKGNK